jgi:CheY-like chemotaxis protein
MADDDAEDRLMTAEALVESRMGNPIEFVENGEDLLDYLRKQGRYAEPAHAPRPGLILLDLNMPRKDGREALAEMKADPDLRQIPVVVLTTSHSADDLHNVYGLGANSYIAKPVTFQGLVEAVKRLGEYWFELVELPSPPE